jgi:UDP-N-acetylmuramoyl-L-alanyl-D-glutamate--2,6-diaminopimelate ligase
VREGVVKAGGTKKLHEIPDRREAIVAALRAAKKGDAILLTGMGHFRTRNMGGKEIPWDERAIARELLKARRP